MERNNIFNIGNQTAGNKIVNVGSMNEKEQPNYTTIWKYDLELTDIQTIRMPERAKVLTAQNQFQKIRLWALVNPDLPTEQRNFRIIGTGHDILESNETLKYISTFQLENGSPVWHIFEVV